MYQDDFSSPGSGWLVREDATGRLGYLNGEYQILVKGQFLVWSTTAPGVRCVDCAVEADGRFSSTAYRSYGLVFGVDDTSSYHFAVDGDERYVLTRYTPQGWIILLNWTSSPYINAGQAANRLRVERVGTQIKLYANGHYLTTVTGSFGSGSLGVGLVASAYSTDMDARFDNFAVYSQSSGAITSVGQEGEAVR